MSNMMRGVRRRSQIATVCRLQFSLDDDEATAAFVASATDQYALAEHMILALADHHGRWAVARNGSRHWLERGEYLEDDLVAYFEGSPDEQRAFLANLREELGP